MDPAEVVPAAWNSDARTCPCLIAFWKTSVGGGYVGVAYFVNKGVSE